MNLLEELQQTEGEQRVKALGGGNLLQELAVKRGEAPPEPFRVDPAKIEAERERMRHYALSATHADMSPFEKLGVGFQKGLRTIGRGVGLMDEEHPSVRRGLNQLTDESGYAVAGDIAGMAAPFMAGAPLQGAGLVVRGRAIIPAAQKLVTRLGLGAAAGGAEGAIIARGEGRDAAETASAAGVGASVGAAVEVLMPVLGRLGRQVFNALGRRPRGPLIDEAGEPTAELLKALKDSGTSWESLTDQAVDFIATQSRGANPEEVARLGRFRSQGIPATRGDITQDFSQQAAEQRLMSMATQEAGEPLRQFKLEQSNAFIDSVNQLVEGLGVPDEVGESVKQALSGRKELLRQNKNKLYKQLAESDAGVARIPLLGNEILEAIPDRRTMRRMERLAPNQVNALDMLLIEFGIDTTPGVVDAFKAAGDEITPLTMGNLEDFRQALNLIERSDTSGAISVVVGPMREALDGEAKAIDDIFEKFGDGGMLRTAREARSTVRTLKTEFSPQAIVGRLVDTKKDGVTPVVEASRVYKELMNKPPEQLQRTLESLWKAEGGRQAIGNLRAAVVLDAFEAALKAPTRKTSGIETVGGNQFAKHLDQNIGKERLEMLFRGSPDQLAALQNLQQTALDITPTAGAVPKGSAPVILDALRRVGRIPGLEDILMLGNMILRAGSDPRAVRRAMDSRPEIKRIASGLERDFPALASALGVAAVLETTEEDE